MIIRYDLSPFALSLSKPVLSACRGQAVEGGKPVCREGTSLRSVEGFDKLSPNGEGSE